MSFNQLSAQTSSDTLAVSDSLQYLPADSTQIDSTLADSLPSPQKKKGALEEPIDYKAVDSMLFDLKTQKVFLYGDAEVLYGSITLKADFIEMDFNKNEVYAKGLPDSTGKIAGKPHFEDDGQAFDADELRYNFKSQKGIIMEAQTQQSEGFIEGERVKKESDKVLYIKSGEFCPCEDPEAGTYLKSSKLKLIQDDKIVTGPAYLVIEDIPTPLAIPFGILPNKQGQASGILIPEPGNSPNQGFFLRNGGYYWAVNDYMDLAFQGDIYSRGSWGARVSSDYTRRYRYNGNMSLSYSVFQTGLRGLPTSGQERNFFVRWNHRQDPKARPNSNFSASVSAGTQNNFVTNFNSSDQDYLTNTFKSNINYTRQIELFGKPGNLTLNASQDQNSLDSSINLVLPEAVLTMQRMFPFKRKNRVGKERWYEAIGFSYTGNFRNRIETSEREIANGVIFDPENPTGNDQGLNLANANNGLQHLIPINTSFKVLKNITVAPTVTYRENWYFKRFSYEWDSVNNVVDKDTTYGFHRYGRVNGSASASTNIYGMYTFRSEKIKAIRHVMTPNVTFNYSPNTFRDTIGYQTDSTGRRAVSTGYEGLIFGAPNVSESGSISFQLRNNLEMKVRSDEDSTESFKKIKLFDQLNASTSYNLFADSMEWQPIQLNSNVSLAQFLTMRVNATFDPYALNFAETRKVNTFEFDRTGNLARLTNFSVALTMKLDNRKRAQKNEDLRPWSANITYNYNLSKPRRDVNITQTVGFQGKYMLTEKWDVGGRTNYDFRTNSFTYTSVNVYRDLNCWELSFNFIPFGNRRSYSFKLNIKPALLRDLKLERRREYFDFETI